MTANGIALPPCGDDDTRVRLQARDAAGLRLELRHHAANGTAEVVVEGEADRLAAAFEADLVDAVTCFVEPLMAIHPTALVTFGDGVATMDEARRLLDVCYHIEDGRVRVDGRIARSG